MLAAAAPSGQLQIYFTDDQKYLFVINIHWRYKRPFVKQTSGVGE
jgi:hypothetical protein